jgi:hypothetical protein
MQPHNRKNTGPAGKSLCHTIVIGYLETIILTKALIFLKLFPPGISGSQSTAINIKEVWIFNPKG